MKNLTWPTKRVLDNGARVCFNCRMATPKRTGFETIDGKPLWGAAKRAHELGKRPKVVVPGKICRCGCGETTKGGDFCMGHDARHKSNLIREAKADSADALAELEQRGWMKFLEKSNNNDQRKDAQAKGIRVVRLVDGQTEEELAAIALQRLINMKRAHELLKAIGRAPKRVAGDKFIMTTGANYEAIIAGERMLPTQHVDEYDELTATEACQIRALQGLDAGAKV